MNEIGLTKKTNISLNSEIMNKLDDMAFTMGLSRSGMISVLVNKEWQEYVDIMTKNQEYKDYKSKTKGHAR